MINYYKVSAFFISATLLAGCTQQATQKTAEQIRNEAADKAAAAVDAASNAAFNEYVDSKKHIDRSGVLRKEMKPLTKKPPFFGINTSLLSAKELAVLKAAGEDFQRIEDGAYPTCTSEPDVALADGGTLEYDCGSYIIVRYKSLTTEKGIDGYIYGPSIDFANGNTVSNVNFYSYAQMSNFLSTGSGH